MKTHLIPKLRGSVFQKSSDHMWELIGPPALPLLQQLPLKGVQKDFLKWNVKDELKLQNKNIIISLWLVTYLARCYFLVKPWCSYSYFKKEMSLWLDLKPGKDNFSEMLQNAFRCVSLASSYVGMNTFLEWDNPWWTPFTLNSIAFHEDIQSLLWIQSKHFSGTKWFS